MRTCIGCGQPYAPNRENQQRCKPHCGRVRNDNGNGARSRTRELTRFVAVDGEGMTLPNGTHGYVLLTVGRSPLHRNGNVLTHRDIFPFLYERYLEDPIAAFVGYYLGYDFTHWFKYLSEDRARRLLTPAGVATRKRTGSGGNPMPFPVHVGEYEWEIDILGLKRFLLRPGLGHEPDGEINRNKWMAVCDVGPFFQQSFLKTIKQWAGSDAVTPEEYAIIREGKVRRSTAVLDETMMEYNALENDILSRIMPHLNDGFKGVGIKLDRKQWYGPGQAAQQWLSLIKAPTAEEIHANVPIEVRDAARCTYYGGWFEIFTHGIVPNSVYEYDINSAYPYVISNLPCLLHGRWEHTTYARPVGARTIGPAALRLVHAHAHGRNHRVGPLPHRSPKGAILRPDHTRGWHWQHELDASHAARLIKSALITETWTYHPCPCPPPFRAIADLYQQRLTVGKNTPHGKAFKLIYNSAYGKMAQSIGSPKYANPLYASLITAGCRTMILNAIATHPTGVDDVVMVATDGVYFRSPHPNLTMSEETLGAWDAAVKQNMCLFMPGLYWDDTSRERVARGEDAQLKSRGVPAGDLSERILLIDQQFRDIANGGEFKWPSMRVPIGFTMVTPGQALNRNKWELCGRVTSYDPTLPPEHEWNLANSKELSSNPKNKRYPFPYFRNGVIETNRYTEVTPVESTPYDKVFGDEELFEFNAETPDGSLNTLLIEALHG